jgi:hypothetical protein
LQGSVQLQKVDPQGTQFPATAMLVQFPKEQESVVQGLLSLQFIWIFWHPVTTSQESVVQGLPSSQLFAVNEQSPVVVTQLSIVQLLLSLQDTALDTLQAPELGSQSKGVQRSPFAGAHDINPVPFAQ